MHIENNAVHASLSQALAARAATSPVQDSNAKKPDTPETSLTGTAKAPPVTGVSRNNLSPDVLDTLIGAQEKITHEKTGTGFDILSDSRKRYLEKVVNDPVYAAEEAKHEAESTGLLLITYADLGIRPGDDLNLHPRALQKLIDLGNQYTEIARHASTTKKELYERMVGQEMPPAQILAKLMTHRAGDSEFNAIKDHGMGWPGGRAASQLQAESDYLQHLIDTKAAPAASVTGNTDGNLPKETVARQPDATAETESAVDEFRAYMEKTPEERLYEAILAKLGLTKEALADLPAEERAKIEALVREEMKKHMAVKLVENDGPETG